MPTIEQLEALLAREPGDAFLMYGLGQACLKAGAHEKAIGWFDRTVQADPSQCYAHYFKARAFEGMGDVPAALEAARAGVAAARERGDTKALSELSALVDELE